MPMRIRLDELRNIIREIVVEEKKKYYFGGSRPEESYESELFDDPSYHEQSVYVPDDIKKKLGKWAKDMGLSTSKK